MSQFLGISKLKSHLLHCSEGLEALCCVTNENPCIRMHETCTARSARSWLVRMGSLVVRSFSWSLRWSFLGHLKMGMRTDEG